MAVDPEFYKSNSKQFVTGDDKLILHERGFLRSHKTRVLHQGEGAIRQIKWKGELVAWANDFVRKILIFFWLSLWFSEKGYKGC